MPKVCFLCGKKYIRGESSSFHQVPKDKQIRKEWLRKMHIDEQDALNLGVYTYLCSSHFQKTDFYFTPFGKRCLKKGIVPQIDLPAMEDLEPTTSQSSNMENIDKENIPPRSLALPTGTSSSTETAFESSEEEPSPKRMKSLNSAFEMSTDKGRECQKIVDSSVTETASESEPFLEEYKNSSTESGAESEQFLVSKTQRQSLLSMSNRKRSQMRYFGDITLKDLQNPAKAKKSWLIIKSTISTQRKRISNLLRARNRLRGKLTNLRALLNYFKDKKLITSENAETTIKASLQGAAGDLFQRCLKGPSRQKYDPLLRSFALTLNFYSPKAYNFVREKFNKSLPHSSTITKWYQSVDGSPGFTSEALIALNIKVSEAKMKGGNVICNLVMDEIAIRKRVEWTGTKTTGYIDIGFGINSDSVPLAKEALVYMLVAVNGHWKIPVGYFLLDGLSASERANLVLKCLHFIHPTGVIISSITFDGTSSNISMANQLGAKIHHVDMKSYFIHPITKNKVFIFLDVSHMLKLVRNCLGSLGIIEIDDMKKIEWKYLENLVNLQNIEGLQAATKFKNRHLQWAQEKMKVKLAAQTLSKSVSDALLFLCEDLRHKDFIGAEETAHFIRIFNDLFDILNSRSRFAKYSFQGPLSPVTKKTFFDFIETAIIYIKSLKLSNISILNSPRKTGFLGFLVCCESLKSFYSTYVECDTPLLKYVITYKFSQDHLEIFFSIIRSKGGFNNNPTARQFESTYKKLLVHAEIKGASTANSIAVDYTSILHCTSKNTLTISESDEGQIAITNFDTVPPEYDYITYSSWYLTDYVIDIVGYISGFVVKCIKKQIICMKCLELLEDDVASSQLQKRKQYGKLLNASQFVKEVCQSGEKSFRFYNKIHNILGGKNKQLNINKMLISKTIENLPASIFDHFGSHIFDGEIFDNHPVSLVKLILKCYFNIRIHFEYKKKEDSKKIIRSLLTKTIIFKHQ